MIMSNFIVFAKMPARNITIWGPRRDMMCVSSGPYGHTQTGDGRDGKNNNNNKNEQMLFEIKQYASIIFLIVLYIICLN